MLLKNVKEIKGDDEKYSALTEIMYIPKDNNKTVFIDNVNRVNNLFPVRCTVAVAMMHPILVRPVRRT